MSVRRHHWTRPRMFKLNPAFRLVKTYRRTISLHLNRPNPKISHTPHLMEYHLGIFSLHFSLIINKSAYRNRRHIKNFILLIHTANTVHLFEILYITGTDSLFSIHPQLTEIQWTPIKCRHICHPELSLFLPILDTDSPTQHHLFISCRTDHSLFIDRRTDHSRGFLCPTIFRTNKNRLIQSVRSPFHINSDSSLHTVISRPPPFTCLP